jgi:hypothetical protein
MARISAAQRFMCTLEVTSGFNPSRGPGCALFARKCYNGPWHRSRNSGWAGNPKRVRCRHATAYPIVSAVGSESRPGARGIAIKPAGLLSTQLGLSAEHPWVRAATGYGRRSRSHEISPAPHLNADVGTRGLFSLDARDRITEGIKARRAETRESGARLARARPCPLVGRGRPYPFYASCLRQNDRVPKTLVFGMSLECELDRK